MVEKTPNEIGGLASPWRGPVEARPLPTGLLQRSV